MADNATLKRHADDTTTVAIVAADELTYSGDTALVALSRLVHVTGAEGSKTTHEVFHAEDSAHTTGDYGFQVLGVRNDTLAALAGTDGDYTPFQVNASGAIYVDGSNSTQPVSGTVTANLGATDNAVLDSIDAAVNGTLTVGSHAVTNAGTFAVQVDGAALTALQLIDDAVYTDATGTPSKGLAVMGTDGTNPQIISTDTSGHVQVDVLSVTGTVTVDLGANNDVTLATLPDTAASDLATISGDTTSIDGKITACDTGAVVISSGTVAVTNAGTFATQVDGAALTALQLIDDVIFVDDTATHTAATTKVAGIGAVATPTDTTVDANDIGMLSMSTDRRLLVDADMATLPDTAGTNLANIDTNTGSIDTNTMSIDGKISNGGGVEAGAVLVTLASDSTGLVSVDDNGGALTVDWNGTAPPIGAGVESTALRVTVATDSTGVLSIDDNGGSLTVDGTLTTVTTLTGSGVAHDAADSGNPHKIGAKATTSLSANTMVADNDRTDLMAGTDGVLITRNHCNLEDALSERATNTDGASTAYTSGMAAPGAGIKLYITKLTVANSSTSFCTVDWRDGAAGSVLWTTPVPGEGGATEVFDPPLELSANTALAYDASAATTTLYLSASGFKSKV